MMNVEKLDLTFISEDEMNKALAIIDNELPWLSDTIVAGFYGNLKSGLWYIKFEDEITVESLEAFIKAWKERN